MRETLNAEEERVLLELYNELIRNPQTSLSGIEERILGYKVGAYLGIGVMYSVAHLERLGMVTRLRGRVMITQKGEQRIKPKARNTNKQNSSAWMWVRDHIVVEIIVGVVVALLVAVIIRGC